MELRYCLIQIFLILSSHVFSLLFHLFFMLLHLLIFFSVLFLHIALHAYFFLDIVPFISSFLHHVCPLIVLSPFFPHTVETALWIAFTFHKDHQCSFVINTKSISFSHNLNVAFLFSSPLNYVFEAILSPDKTLTTFFFSNLSDLHHYMNTINMPTYVSINVTHAHY